MCRMDKTIAIRVDSVLHRLITLRRNECNLTLQAYITKLVMSDLKESYIFILPYTHGRLLALKDMNAAEVPCIRLTHLSEEQKRAYILAHNKLTMNSGFDSDLLMGELDFLKESGYDTELTGFSLDELEKMFSDDDMKPEVQEDDFDVDSALDESKPTFSKSGDIWTLGNHRLICGDSTKEETYTALMQGKKANLIMTDPPYGVDYVGKSESVHKTGTAKIKNDKFSNDDVFYEFMLAAFRGMESALADDGAAYIFHADTKGLLCRRAFDEAGFKLSGTCVWVKNTFVMGRCDYHWGHEPCLYGWKKSGKHNWYGDRKQSTIWHCDKPARSEKHPTMKPIPLLAAPILNSTQTNGIVLEPFGGSGSTLICCEQLGRVCYAIELDERFVDVIIERFRSVNPDAEISVERDGNVLLYKEVVGD